VGRYRPPHPELSTLALTTGSLLMLEVHASLEAYICKKLQDPATVHLRLVLGARPHNCCMPGPCSERCSSAVLIVPSPPVTVLPTHQPTHMPLPLACLLPAPPCFLQL
jgi:hypothetical protein